MSRLRSAIRFALLALLAAAALNGIMVFFFFDGTNFYGHLRGIGAREDAEREAGRIRSLEGKIAQTRAEGKLARIQMEKSLRGEYAHLDTVLRNADLLFRYPIPKKRLEGKFRADHPFRIEDGKIAICIQGGCFYEENQPRYARPGSPRLGARPRDLAALADLGGQPAGSAAFEFELAKKSGPFELWEAYRRLDDSTFAYYCNYLLNAKGKRLMRRGTDLEREGSFMGEASASGNFLMIDHGCCPGVRGLSVLDGSGKTLLEASYIGDAVWRQDTLAFFEPAEGKPGLPDPCTPAGLEPVPARLTLFRAGAQMRTGSRKIFCGQGPPGPAGAVKRNGF